MPKAENNDHKVQEENFRVCGTVLYLDCDDGYTNVCVCQNSEIHTKKDEFYNIYKFGSKPELTKITETLLD